MFVHYAGSPLPMVGTHLDLIQIDEARFAGKRKYPRGRMLQGDHLAESEDHDEDIYKISAIIESNA